LKRKTKSRYPDTRIIHIVYNRIIEASWVICLWKKLKTHIFTVLAKLRAIINYNHHEDIYTEKETEYDYLTLFYKPKWKLLCFTFNSVR